MVCPPPGSSRSPGHLGEINANRSTPRAAGAAEDGRAKATDRFTRFRRGPVTIVPARESLVLEAAELKGRYSLSYADAFAVATARQAKLPIVTGDPEILELPGSVVRVRRIVRHR